LPGRYPEPANSQLFINDAGRLKPHPLDLGADASGNTASSGMISAATWADLDDDGFPELILSADWGPPRIFRNVQGRLSSWDPPVRITTDDDHLLSTDPSGPQPSRPRFTRLSE